MNILHAVTRHTCRISIPVFAALLLGGCQTMYYGAMEKVGIEKRDIQVDRVDNARAAQENAKEQFRSALDKFIAITNYSGGDLEAQYNLLMDEYEDSLSRAGGA